MDLTQPVEYRRFLLNNPHRQSSGGPITGCILERVNYSNVPGVGYTEKRALGDGYDASDVFMGMRRIQLQGTIYALTPGELFDRKQALVAAFSPTLAYAESPSTFGYLPLDWYEPTADTRYVNPNRHVYCFVRPSSLPQFEVIRDKIGRKNAQEGLALQWQTVVEAKDPRIYLDPAHYYYFYPNSSTSGSGTFLNRGDYPAPLQVLLEITAHADTRYWHFTGGGVVMTITLPITTVTQIFRYDGYLKILTVEENDKVGLRMDLLDFDAEITHPLIQSGLSNWMWTRNTAPGLLLIEGQAAGEPVEDVEVNELQSTNPETQVIDPPPTHPDNSSRFWFSEAFA